MQPYRALFPIGVLYAIWGTLLWILFRVGLAAYPGAAHASLMISGFLFSFALGFLLTAVPKFTGSEPASAGELAFACALALGPLAVETGAVGAAAPVLRHAVGGLILLFLAVFFLSRFRQRVHAPPKQFVFIPMGIAFGVIGAALLALGETGRLGPGAMTAGRTLLYQGTMLCFTLGVGGRLLASLLGWSDSPLVQLSPGIERARRESWLERNGAISAQASLVLASFALEAATGAAWPRILRAAAAAWIGFSAWKLHRLPRIRGSLTTLLWVSGWTLVLGVVVHAVLPSQGVHGLHLMFIGGFALMTVGVASRVTLAHGGFDLALEKRSPALRIGLALILLAAITRATAHLTTDYVGHLAYASGTWIAAIALWSMAFVPRIVAPDWARSRRAESLARPATS